MQAENPPTSDFCGKCGAPLTNGSGAPVAISSPRGSASDVRVAPESRSSETLDGERKTVTALFADIKGSMELMEDLDPEEARAIVDPALKLMIDAVHRYDGYVVQSTGDGIFALFGAPIAHEDHPQRALYRRAPDAGGPEAILRPDARGGGSPIQVRVGVNTGEVVVRIDQDRRSAHRVHPDRSFDQSRGADAGAGADRVDRDQRAGPQVRRGLLHAKAAWADAGQGRQRAGQGIRGDRPRSDAHPTAALGESRTIPNSSGATRDGRDDSRAEQAKAGHGQIVAAMGEPGVGKSRLF